MPTVSVITPVYRGEPYLSAYFEALASQTLFNDLEVVLVHNQPSSVERGVVQVFADKHPGKLVYVVVDERNASCLDHRPGRWALETVAQSMNRAIEQASSEYIALWNVDDVRVSDSLERQVGVLDSNAGIGLTYGDCVMVRHPGDRAGTQYTYLDFDPDNYMCTYAGAFQMWRRSVHDIAGLFDEQLRSGADCDLWIRIAGQFLMKKTPGDLGYYLDAGLGLSTRKEGLRFVEAAVVGLRYGILHQVDCTLLRETRHYRVDELYFNGAWHAVRDYFPEYDVRIASFRRAWPRELLRQRRTRLWRGIAELWRGPRHAAGVLLRRIGVFPPRNLNGR